MKLVDQCWVFKKKQINKIGFGTTWNFVLSSEKKSQH